MTHWASLYVEEVAHGKSRLAEYDLVGRLLADKTLRDFSGKAGARLIKQLLIDWRDDRRPRSKKEPQIGAPAPKPLGDQTLRLRLFALLRIIRFANDKLPSDAPFDVPDMRGLFEFKPPPAHAAPRDRQPGDAEFARLLAQAGVDSEFGQFTRVIDETGCRLSEVLKATGANVQFFTAAGEVIGGYLTLRNHKTARKVGPREVPLSLLAARLLHARKLKHGDGQLFPGLGDTNKVCKDFDTLCGEVGLDDLLMKDFRRSFINRNKYCVAHMDLVGIVGASSMLDAKNVFPSERALLDAVGHTDIKTTGGYSKPHLANLSQIFTRSSRWAQVASQLHLGDSPAADLVPPSASADVAAVQQLLLDTFANLRQAGVVESSTGPTSSATPATVTTQQAEAIAATEAMAAAPSCDVAAKLAPIWRGQQADATLARAYGSAQQAQEMPATDIGAGTESSRFQLVGVQAPAPHPGVRQGQVAHMPANRGLAATAEFQPLVEGSHDSPRFAQGNRCPDDIDQAHALSSHSCPLSSRPGELPCPTGSSQDERLPEKRGELYRM